MMLVPEAPMDEDDLATSWKNDIWPSRQCSDMESEAIAEGMGRAADGQFGSGINGADRRHVAASSFTGLKPLPHGRGLPGVARGL